MDFRRPTLLQNVALAQVETARKGSQHRASDVKRLKEWRQQCDVARDQVRMCNKYEAQLLKEDREREDKELEELEEKREKIMERKRKRTDQQPTYEQVLFEFHTGRRHRMRKSPKSRKIRKSPKSRKVAMSRKIRKSPKSRKIRKSPKSRK